MKIEQRQKAIIEACKERGSITILEAFELFPDVTVRTIMRDLETIAESGQISWESGRHGVPGKIIWAPHKDLSYRERLLVNVSEKKEVAEIAAMFARSADVVFVDGGTTLGAFLDLIIEDRSIERLGKVVTMSLDIADKLAAYQARSNTARKLGYLIGGPIRADRSLAEEKREAQRQDKILR